MVNEIQIAVTILILIDGFLQLGNDTLIFNCSSGHNPYFNRWFSAIIMQIKAQ